jgi:hypothetical protein
MKGDSTCFAPICIKIKKFATNAKKANLLKGLNCRPLLLPKSVNGITNKINMAENIAITPNNLLGIDLYFSYYFNKYHSGTIAGGVCIGLAIT